MQLAILHPETRERETRYQATATRLAPADAVYQTVVWTSADGERTLADLGEKRDAGIRLRFRLDGVTLHAFKLAKSH